MSVSRRRRLTTHAVVALGIVSAFVVLTATRTGMGIGMGGYTWQLHGWPHEWMWVWRRFTGDGWVFDHIEIVWANVPQVLLFWAPLLAASLAMTEAALRFLPTQRGGDEMDPWHPGGEVHHAPGSESGIDRNRFP